MKKLYLSACHEVPEFSKFSYHEFLEVNTLINSRGYNITINGIKMPYLIPFADMINHDYSNQTAYYYDKDRKGFVILAKQDIPKDAEVTVCYGSQISNYDFFFVYGFICQPNFADEVQLQIQIDRKYPAFEEK